MNNTSPLYVNTSKTKEERTSPIYVQEKGKLALNDILNEKPSDFNGQVDISWLQDALNKKAVELKYAPWDAIAMPDGLWVSSAFGNNTIVVCSADGYAAYSSDYGLSWKKVKICDNINAVAFGQGIFIACGNKGALYISEDKGKSWQKNSVDNYDYTSAAFNNNTFLLGTSCGKILISHNKGKSFIKSADYENMMIAKIIYEKDIIMAVSPQSDTKCIYSLDHGITYNKLNLPASKWCSLTYGNEKFIFCAYDGDVRICECSYKSIINKTPELNEIHIYKKAQWKDTAFGGNVFVLVSNDGFTMASHDGIRWIETKCPKGEWNNVLRTDYFFLAFSIKSENHNLNAIKSTNGGLAGIMFASLDEIKNNEIVDKAVNPTTLKDYLEFRTGKEESKYPVYSKDLLIECTSSDTLQIKITNILNESSITSFDDIKTSGIYIIEKKLSNQPKDYTILYMLVQNNNGIIYQFASDDYSFTLGHIRSFNEKWLPWDEKFITSKNIKITENSTFSASTTLLMKSNDNIVNVDKEGLVSTITERLKKHGKTDQWNNTSDYSAGALVLGSDNALYFAVKDNGAALSLIKDPVTESAYWTKIINGNGIINKDNLDLTLGSFAFLNSIGLDDYKISGSLPIAKGGTGHIYGSLPMPKYTEFHHNYHEDFFQSSYNVGDIIWKIHVALLKNEEATMPNGGTWLLFYKVINYNGELYPHKCNLSIMPGGQRIPVDHQLIASMVMVKIA